MSKILSLERDWIRENPKFHLRSRLSKISSLLGENGSENTSFFHFILPWVRIISPERDMQKNLHKPIILLNQYFIQPIILQVYTLHWQFLLKIIQALSLSHWTILSIYTYIWFLNQNHLKSNNQFSSNISFELIQQTIQIHSLTHSIPNSYTFYNIYYIYNFSFQSQTIFNLLKNKNPVRKFETGGHVSLISKFSSLGFYWQFKLVSLTWTWVFAC